MSDTTATTDKGSLPHRSATALKAVLVNLLIIAVPFVGYYLLVLDRNSRIEQSHNFRALEEIHQQGQRSVQALVGLFNAVEVPEPSGDGSAGDGKDGARSLPDDGGLPITVRSLGEDWYADRCGHAELESESREGDPVPELSRLQPRFALESSSDPLNNEVLTVYPCHLGRVEGGAVSLSLPVRRLFADSTGLARFDMVYVGTRAKVFTVLSRETRVSPEPMVAHQPIADIRPVIGLAPLVDQAHAEWLAELEADGIELDDPPASLVKNAFIETDVGGRRYLAYIKPISSALLGIDEDDPIYLVGLETRASFVEAAKRVDSRLLLAVLVVVATLFVGWPILRLLLTDPENPVSISHLWAIGASFIAVLAVLVCTFKAVDQALEINAYQRELAIQVADNINDYLGRSLMARIALIRQIDRVAIDRASVDGICSSSTACDDGRQMCYGLGEGNDGLINYAFRSDEKGMIEWPMLAARHDFCRSFPDAIDISPRPYFQIIAQDQAPPFAAQRLFNWADGMKMLQLATARERRDDGEFAGIVSADTLLHEMVHAVLPLGFTFAVFENANGTVLFHADDRRALVENVLLETNRDPQLLQAIFNQQPASFSEIYHGRSTRFHYRTFAAELDAVDWGILVGHDAEFAWRIARLAWTNTAGVIVVAFLLLALFGFIVNRTATGRRVLGVMIWPKRERPTRYLIGIVVVVLGVAVFSLLPGWTAIVLSIALVFAMTAVVQSEWLEKKLGTRDLNLLVLWNTFLVIGAIVLGGQSTAYVYDTGRDYHYLIQVIKQSEQTFAQLEHLLPGEGDDSFPLFPQGAHLRLTAHEAESVREACPSSSTELSRQINPSLWMMTPSVLRVYPEYQYGETFVAGEKRRFSGMLDRDRNRSRLCELDIGASLEIGFDGPSEADLSPNQRIGLRTLVVLLFAFAALTYLAVALRLLGYWKLTGKDEPPPDPESREDFGCIESQWPDLDQAAKRALCQLAWGFIPGSDRIRELEDLESRGLCKTYPFPHISNAATTAYVRNHVSRKERQEWLYPKATAGLWRAVKTPLILLMVVAIAWLAYSAGDAFQALAGLIGTVVAFLANFDRISGFVKGTPAA